MRCEFRDGPMGWQLGRGCVVDNVHVGTENFVIQTRKQLLPLEQ